MAERGNRQLKHLQKLRKLSDKSKKREYFRGNGQKLITNFLDEIAIITNSLFSNPAQALASIITLVAGVLGIYQWITSGVQDQQPVYQPSEGILSEFPARVLLFLILASAIAGSVSTAFIWLTVKRAELQIIIAYALAISGGLALALCTSWVFKNYINNNEVSVFIFTVVGIIISVFFAKWNLKQTLETDREIVATRAALLMTFVSVTSVTVLFERVFLNNIAGF